MRSNPPQKEADRTSYYELLVARTGELSLVRYSRAAGQPRESIPAHVTREVLCRLAGDLSAAARTHVMALPVTVVVRRTLHHRRRGRQNLCTVAIAADRSAGS